MTWDESLRTLRHGVQGDRAPAADACDETPKRLLLPFHLGGLPRGEAAALRKVKPGGVPVKKDKKE